MLQEQAGFAMNDRQVNVTGAERGPQFVGRNSKLKKARKQVENAEHVIIARLACKGKVDMTEAKKGTHFFSRHFESQIARKQGTSAEHGSIITRVLS